MMETPWWDHDPELLGEALSVFADWKDDDSSDSIASVGSDRKTSTLVSTPAHGPRPVKINRSRERQKQEMRELQEHAVELQEELQRLRIRREKRQRTPASSAQAALVALPSSVTAIQAWEKAARRQFRARRKAETVNMRLREMYRAQTDVAEDLFRVIQRAEAARQQAYGTALFPVREPGFPLSPGASDQELQHKLMTISAQWHLPFEQCAKFQNREDAPLERTFFETTIVRDDEIESVVEIRASAVFPHQRHRMEEELWKYFRTLSCTEDDFSLATDLQEDSDTLLGSLRATVAKDGVLGVLDARVMKQQFRNERGELIIASTTCGRPGLRRTRGPFVDEEFRHMDAIVSEDSWLRVLDAEGTHDAGSGSSLTCIQNVRRARIRFHGTDRPDRQQIDAVKKFLARLAENEMHWGSEVVERRLMLGPCNLMSMAA